MRQVVDLPAKVLATAADVEKYANNSATRFAIMKILCGISGILFVFLANFLPVPDPGLATALLACGGALCISALALELHPLIALITEEADLTHLHHHVPDKPKEEPEPAAG